METPVERTANSHALHTIYGQERGDRPRRIAFVASPATPIRKDSAPLLYKGNTPDKMPGTGRAPMLKIEKLTHVYGNGTRALDAVDLEVPAGMFGLLGP